jgi:hypothetical protein
MSLREKLDMARQKLREIHSSDDNLDLPTQAEYTEMERRELAHSALFSEIVEIRGVCDSLLNGHPVLREPICDDEGTKYIICCISGTTTRIKIISKDYIDDYSVNEYICSRKLTEYSEDRKPQTVINFDVTSGYMNGFSEEELTAQLKALCNLRERLLLASGYLINDNTEDAKEHYAA